MSATEIVAVQRNDWSGIALAVLRHIHETVAGSDFASLPGGETMDIDTQWRIHKELHAELNRRGQTDDTRWCFGPIP